MVEYGVGLATVKVVEKVATDTPDNRPRTRLEFLRLPSFKECCCPRPVREPRKLNKGGLTTSTTIRRSPDKDEMTQDEPQTLIIDTDPGVDDVLAILLALSRPDLVRLEAITLNFGNTTLDYARDNVLRLFNVLHAHVQQEGKGQEGLKRSLSGSAYRTIFASKGAEGPIGGEQFTASYFHGRDGLSGISQLHGDPFATSKSIPSPLVEDATKPAHEVILDILRNNAPGTVRIAAVAPLTNLALAFQSDPETFCRVGGISVMGGVLDGPGNTTATSEFNTYADPFAAKVLLHDAPLHPVLQDAKRNACGYTGSLPIELLPLDITRKHTVPYARLCDDVDQRGGILRSLSVS